MMELDQFILSLFFIGLAIVVIAALIGFTTSRWQNFRRSKRQIRCRICSHRYMDHKKDKVSECPNCQAKNKR